MTSIIASLTPKTEELRETFLGHLLSAATIAQRDEPDTLRYLIAVPHDADPADPGSIYIIEEYLNDAGFELHCKQPSVQKVRLMISDDTVKGTPLTLILGVDHNFGFTRPEISQISEPFVVIVQLFHKPGTGAEALRALESMVETSRQDSGTLGFVLFPDSKDLDAVRFMGIYKSQDHYFNVHLKSKETEEFRVATNHIVIERKAHFLKPIGGFLSK